MKKGLLLSVVASTMIFAGGDIAPVEPAAAAPAADCSDFYGQVGMYYQSQQGDDWGTDAGDLFSTDKGVGVTNFSVTAAIGVEKEIANGIGFGAEVAGWSSLGWPDNSVDDANNVTRRVTADNNEGGELSLLYMTASFNNTAIKVGRFALPFALSPYAYTDATAGVKDYTYEGGLVANTDLADTTVYGVYVRNATNENTRIALGADDLGVFALGFVNKSIADTTITGVGYYVPDAAIDASGDDQAVYAGFLTVDRNFGDYKANVQIAAIGGDDGGNIADGPYAFNAAGDTTFGIAAKISGKFSMIDASLAASYINDGSYAMSPVLGYSLVGTDHAEAYEVYVGANGNSYATVAVVATVGAKVGFGYLYGSAGYWDYDTTDSVDRDTTAAARVGYKFKVAGIDTKVEYRYRVRTDNAGNDVERHRVRVEAVYKF